MRPKVRPSPSMTRTTALPFDCSPSIGSWRNAGTSLAISSTSCSARGFMARRCRSAAARSIPERTAYTNASVSDDLAVLAHLGGARVDMLLRIEGDRLVASETTRARHDLVTAPAQLRLHRIIEPGLHLE